MKLSRNLFLMIAGACCTAMVMAPAVAAGTGQTVTPWMNQGAGQAQAGNLQGNNAVLAHPATAPLQATTNNNPVQAVAGTSITAQSQNPGRGTQPGGSGNVQAQSDQALNAATTNAGSGSQAMNAQGTGSMTAPPEIPAMNSGDSPFAGNMTAPPDIPVMNGGNSSATGTMTPPPAGSGNVTEQRLPPAWDAGNTTAVRDPAGSGYGAVNGTMPEPVQRGTAASQAGGETSDGIIAELLDWLKAHTDS